MKTPVSLMDDQMVDMAFITQLTGLTDKWFYKLIKDGAFPAPIKLGRSSRWLKSEVEAWLQALDWPPESPDNQYHLNK
ncbi:helix-turn-helix transcriptional regulator [Escherichia coli]|uniref:helix-turn-helix transcriptional regulator n=1 Tax=Escherichia coli TaxID=562 RepID=UPI000DA5AD83|nr:AlpA family phage regulatory protein [Escherichia coli]SRY23046.1 putative phage-related regulatory protein [Escherichia coli]